MRPVHRYFNRNGKQRPLLGVTLQARDPLSRAADPVALRRLWWARIATCARLGLDLVALPHLGRPHADDVLYAVKAAAQAGLGCLLTTDGDTRDIELIAAAGRVQPDLLVQVSDALCELERTVEEVIHPACSRSNTPVVATTHAPLATGGRAARNAARTCEATSVASAEHESDPASLVASVLAARPSDRPCVLQYRGHDPAVPFRAALVAGAAGVVFDPAGPDDALPESELAELAGFLDALPFEMSDPRSEDAAVLLLDESEGAAQPIDAALGALLLLQRGTATTPRLAFQEHPDQHVPRLVQVPAHGPLPATAWARCWSLASGGSHVLVTALTTEGLVTRERLGELGIAPNALPPDRAAELPPWLRDRTVLDTGGALVTRAVGKGRLCFLDQPVELRPSEEDGLRLLGALAKDAGLEGQAFLREGNLTALRRVLEFPDGELCADLTVGSLSWASR